MGNDFFNDHPMLGSVFDFNHNGSLDLGEAGTIGAFGAMYASEMMRASKEAEREANYDYDYDSDFDTNFDADFDDDFDTDFSFNSNKRKKSKKDSCEDLWDDDPWEKKLSTIDANDNNEVFYAVVCSDLDEPAREMLLYEALENDLVFSQSEVDEMIARISDKELKKLLQWRADGDY